MSPFLAAAIALNFIFIAYPAAAVVLLVVNSSSSSFRSKAATFSPDLEGSGTSGYVALGNPADACSALESPQDFSSSPFLLAMMGNCSSEAKVRNGQDAGFAAVIIYNNESGTSLPSITGSSEGITVYAVSITKAAGETLAQYADDANVTVWILPSYEDTVWSAIVFTLITVLAIAAGLFTWYIVRRDRNRRQRKFKGPTVISARIVEAMPATIYKVTGNEKAIQEVCTICLEDYIPGEKLRILPCSHRFHSTCVDAWLTLWQAVCPNCKRDARYEFPDLQATERTPLLNFSWPSSSESTPIQIPPAQSDFQSGTPSFSKGASSSRVSHPRIPDKFRHFTSLESSLEAFRASPYFTPPSMSYNPSPLAYGCSPAMASPSPYSGGSSRDLESKSFLNPRRGGASSPAIGSYSSLSSGSQSTYLNPGKAKTSSTT